MSLYVFTREDFAKVIRNSLFREGVAMSLRPSLENESLSCLQKFVEGRGKVLCLASYVSYRRPGTEHTEESKEAEDLNLFIQNLAVDETDPAYWAYINNCEVQATLITYSTLRLLYPTMPLYLFVFQPFNRHLVLSNVPIEIFLQSIKESTSFRSLSRDLSQPLIFDPISQVMGGDIEWFFLNPEAATTRIGNTRILEVAEGSIIPWYIQNLYRNIPRSEYETFLLWFKNLTGREPDETIHQRELTVSRTQ